MVSDEAERRFAQAFCVLVVFLARRPRDERPPEIGSARRAKRGQRNLKLHTKESRYLKRSTLLHRTLHDETKASPRARSLARTVVSVFGSRLFFSSIPSISLRSSAIWLALLFSLSVSPSFPPRSSSLASSCSILFLSRSFPRRSFPRSYHSARLVSPLLFMKPHQRPYRFSQCISPSDLSLSTSASGGARDEERMDRR